MDVLLYIALEWNETGKSGLPKIIIQLFHGYLAQHVVDVFPAHV